jgi:HSP20 family protein
VRRVPDGGEPHVREEPENNPHCFEKATHRYDSCMAARRDIDRLKSEMEELFADLCQHRLAPHRTGFRPRVDVYSTEGPDCVNVVIELAGVEPEDLEIAVADGVLTVSGTRRRRAGEARRYQHMEIDYGPFERRVQLGDAVDADAAEARYERGFLTVVLPLAQRAGGPVRLNVTRGGQS